MDLLAEGSLATNSSAIQSVEQASTNSRMRTPGESVADDTSAVVRMVPANVGVTGGGEIVIVCKEPKDLENTNLTRIGQISSAPEIGIHACQTVLEEVLPDAHQLKQNNLTKKHQRESDPNNSSLFMTDGVEVNHKHLEEAAYFVAQCSDKQQLMVIKRILMTRLKEIFNGEPERNYELRRGYWHETWSERGRGKRIKYVNKELSDKFKELLKLSMGESNK